MTILQEYNDVIDEDEELTKEGSEKSRHTRTHNRRIKRRLEKLRKINEHRYPSPVVDTGKYNKRIYRRRISKYLKRQSNKRIRKSKEGFPKKSRGYLRKFYEYEWELD